MGQGEHGLARVAGQVRADVVLPRAGQQRDQPGNQHQRADQHRDAARHRPQERAQGRPDHPDQAEVEPRAQQAAYDARVGEGHGRVRAGHDPAREEEGDQRADRPGHQSDDPEHGRLGPQHRQPARHRRQRRADHAGRVLPRRDQHAEHAQRELREVRAEQGQAHGRGVGEVAAHGLAGGDPRLVLRRSDEPEGHQEQQGQAQRDPRRAQRPELGPLRAQYAQPGHPVFGARHGCGGGLGVLCRGDGAHAALPGVSMWPSSRGTPPRPWSGP